VKKPKEIETKPNQPKKQQTLFFSMILINYGWKRLENPTRTHPPLLALQLDAAWANAPWHPPADGGDFKKAQNKEESFE